MPAEERTPAPTTCLSRRTLFGAAVIAAAIPAIAAQASAPSDFGEWERERDRLFKVSSEGLDEHEYEAFEAAWALQYRLLDTPCVTRHDVVVKLRAVLHPEIGADAWAEPEREMQAIRQVLAFLEAN